MEPRGIHHVGVAVADLDGAVSTYERLFGASLERRDTLPEQGVEAAAMRLGDGRVELLAALGEDTPVGVSCRSAGPACTTSRSKWVISPPRCTTCRPPAAS